jgi:hypothetical protein
MGVTRPKLLLMIVEFRPVEGNGSLSFMFADDPGTGIRKSAARQIGFEVLRATSELTHKGKRGGRLFDWPPNEVRQTAQNPAHLDPADLP